MDSDRDPLALPDPEGVAKELLRLWWEAHVADLPTEADRYKVIDHKLEVAECFARLLREERAATLRMARRHSSTWREVVAEIGRPESTLRSQAQQR